MSDIQSVSRFLITDFYIPLRISYDREASFAFVMSVDIVVPVSFCAEKEFLGVG